jgi:hypothetical protein
MAAKQPWYRVMERNGYLYVRFRNIPPVYIRNRMKAAGLYFNRTERVWIADDRFNDLTISRIIGTPLSEAPTEEVSI